MRRCSTSRLFAVAVAVTLAGGAGIVFAAPATAAPGDTTASDIAEAYGFDRWDEVAELRFTFVAYRKGERIPRRQWVWDVASDTVTLSAMDGLDVAFTPFDPQGEDETKGDRRFINDTYWLLFPFQLVWGGPGVTVQTQGVRTPIGDEPAVMAVAAAFGDEGGYTPGDTYTLYFDAPPAEGGLVTHWVYESPRGRRLVTTWEDHARLGPIVVPTRFRNRGGFEIRMEDLSATLVTGERVEPVPVDGSR